VLAYEGIYILRVAWPMLTVNTSS